MCRTDVQLMDGYFEKYSAMPFPATPGHEIAGTIDKIGSCCAQEMLLEEQSSSLPETIPSLAWRESSSRHASGLRG